MDWMMLIYDLKNSFFRTLYAMFSIFVMAIAFRFLDVYLIRNIDTLEELKKGNIAMGIVVAGLFIGASILIGLISI